MKRSDIQVKMNSKEDKYDTRNEENTLVSDERLSLMAEHKVEILTNDPPLSDVDSQGKKNIKELGLL